MSIGLFLRILPARPQRRRFLRHLALPPETTARVLSIASVLTGLFLPPGDSGRIMLAIGQNDDSLQTHEKPFRIFMLVPTP